MLSGILIDGTVLDYKIGNEMRIERDMSLLEGYKVLSANGAT